MFASFSRSWKFAKMSYAMVWCHKRLLVFPLVSTLAALLVSASFLIPLWTTGQIEAWTGATGEGGTEQGQAVMYGVAFLFYFCNYFVVVFFNTGLLACAMKIARGETATVGEGMGFAMKRLPQIFGWALVSAVVGVILKSLEQNEKIGRFISAILGSAWTALTYFVVPVITMEGLGPVGAFKRSTRILREQWGTALVGNFSLGVISFLIMLPAILLGGGLIFLGVNSGSMVATLAAAGAGVLCILFAGAASSAADMIFKSYLYTFATGNRLPENVDDHYFSQAFRPAK